MGFNINAHLDAAGRFPLDKGHTFCSSVTWSANGKQNIQCGFEDVGIINDGSVTEEKGCEYKTGCLCRSLEQICILC